MIINIMYMLLFVLTAVVKSMVADIIKEKPIIHPRVADSNAIDSATKTTATGNTR